MSVSQLFLIDAHALCYRSYYAIKSLSTSYGQATNAVYGFTNTLKKILREYEPAYLAVCFDSRKKTHRQEKFAEYKIHRPSMPDDLIGQIPLIKEVVGAYQLPIFEMEGFEADDIIATLAKKAEKEKLEVVIVSDDKDMMQLITDKIKIFSSRQDAVLDRSQACERFGIDPAHITDYIGLAGDSTDNIPGVKGIGEVTARQLINEFGTLENILAHAEQVAPKIREKLVTQKEMAIFSKELAVLDDQVPLEFNLEQLRVKPFDGARLSEVFRQLEFKKFADEFSVKTDQPSEVAAIAVKSKKEIESLYGQIKTNGRCTFLPELSAGGDPAECMRILVSCENNIVYAISAEDVCQLRGIFENPDILKITHDSKRARKVLKRMECELRGKVFDVMLAGYLAITAPGSFDISGLAWAFLKQSGSDEQFSRQLLLVEQLYHVLKVELEGKALIKLFEEVEVPLAYVLFKMEEEGVSLDLELLDRLSRECDKKIQGLLSEIYKLAEGELNLNSPKQLSQLLFERLKLPVVKKTKTGFSTDESVLLKLAEHHPIVAQILEYRQLTKLKSTYIDALPKLVHPQTHRIHASFNQTGAETGRLSSSNPNLQNIPIRAELGQQIRKAFIPNHKDHVILSADYSQIELRILAHLSQDAGLMEAFRNDEDIHAATAAKVFDVQEGAITPLMRNAAKRVNFGLIYGISAFGLAKDLKVSQAEAQDFIDRYFLRYPGVKKFMDQEIAKAEKNGYVLTLLNRRRYLPEINSKNMAVRQFAQRQAINTPVQGSAADMIKLAMINIHQELEKKELRSRLIITVHDELVFDVVGQEQEVMIELVREKMERAMALDVPVKVCVKIGKNWLDTEET